MSANKNLSLAIGAFIVGAIVLVFVALLFFSGGRLFADKERVVMYFEGSVQGLQVGAPVKLKGVVLGEIVNIEINFQRDDVVVVTAVTADLVMKRINSEGSNVNVDFLEKAVNNGLRAQLNYQSLLTGLLYVELDFYPGSALRRHNLQHNYVELPTIATSFEEISRSLQELDLKGLVDNLNTITQKIGDIVGDGQIQSVMDNFNQATTAIAQTSQRVDTELSGLGGDVKATLSGLNNLLAQLNNQAPHISASLDRSFEALERSLDNFDAATTNLNQLVSEDAPLVYHMQRALEDISRSAQSLRNLTDNLDKQPEALLRGKKAPPEKE